MKFDEVLNEKFNPIHSLRMRTDKDYKKKYLSKYPEEMEKELNIKKFKKKKNKKELKTAKWMDKRLKK